MPLQRSNTADKIIVDRRKPHRNSDVARAVRKTRDRLSQQAGNPDFDRELLKLHARAMVERRRPPSRCSSLAIAHAGLLAGMSSEIARLGAVHRHLLCRSSPSWPGGSTAPKLRAQPHANDDGDFLIGAFSAAASAGPGSPGSAAASAQVDQFPVVKAVVLLLAMAATAVMASSLRGALLATFAVPGGALCLCRHARLWMPVEAIMAGLLVVSPALLRLCRAATSTAPR